MSMKPGHTHEAREVERRRAVRRDPLRRRARCGHPRRERRALRRFPPTGSTTLAFLSSSFTVPSGQQVEHGHAHGDAASDLIEDDRRLAVGDVAHDLDARG